MLYSGIITHAHTHGMNKIFTFVKRKGEKDAVEEVSPR